jgi:hypothetical protein
MHSTSPVQRNLSQHRAKNFDTRLVLLRKFLASMGEMEKMSGKAVLAHGVMEGNGASHA